MASDKHGIVLGNNANLTIEGSGKITRSGSTGTLYFINVNGEGKTLTINGGVFEDKHTNTLTMINVTNKGKCVVNDGAFTSYRASIFKVDGNKDGSEGELEINDGTFNARWGDSSAGATNVGQAAFNIPDHGNMSVCVQNYGIANIKGGNFSGIIWSASSGSELGKTTISGAETIINGALEVGAYEGSPENNTNTPILTFSEGTFDGVIFWTCASDGGQHDNLANKLGQLTLESGTVTITDIYDTSKDGNRTLDKGQIKIYPFVKFTYNGTKAETAKKYLPENYDLKTDGTTFKVSAESVVTAEFVEDKQTGEEKTKFKVSIGEVANGTVKLSAEGNVEEGTEITVMAAADEGFKLDKILVNGKAIDGNKFTVAGASVVTAEFVAEEKPVVTEYAIKVTEPKNGKVTVPEKTKKGDEVTITATPDNRYKVNTITVKDKDGKAVEVKNNKFTMPESDVTVEVTFTRTSSSGGSSSGGSSSGGSSSGGSSSGGSYNSGSSSTTTTTTTPTAPTTPTVDGKAVTTSQLNDNIKNSTETTVKVDVTATKQNNATEVTTTVAASTTKAVTDTVNTGAANKTVEVAVSDTVTLVVDKNNAKSIDSTKPIVIAEQKRTEAPARKADNTAVRCVLSLRKP